MLYRLDFCFAYIDDILVFSNNHNKHLEHLQIISRKLTDYDIIINSGKSIFGVTSVTFLGYEISAEGTQLLPEHVAAFQEISLPKTVLISPQRFLGILNFYRRLLPLAAKHQSSLNAAIANLRGPQPVPWTSNLKDSFAACKASLSNAILLVHPSSDAPFSLFTDASSILVRAYLQQLVDNNWQPLIFFLRN